MKTLAGLMLFRDIKANSVTLWSITILKYTGFWAPESLTGLKKSLYRLYTIVSFIFLLGIYLTIQAVDLCVVWGNLPLMTSDAFLLLTNVAQTAKIVTIVTKQKSIQRIISDLDKLSNSGKNPMKQDILYRQGRRSLNYACVYGCITFNTLLSWVLSPIISRQFGELPLNAWYPYATNKSPAYELTYAHQAVAVFIAATLNIAQDNLVISLMSQISCQLMLLKYDLTQISTIVVPDKLHEQDIIQMDSVRKENLQVENVDNNNCPDDITMKRLKKCIIHHQKILSLVDMIENCFNFSIFCQLSVSLFIICVTEFQLAEQLNGDIGIIYGISSYLFVMVFQVFLYCWNGNEVIVQSKEVIVSAYTCDWHSCSPRFRKDLLNLMTRSMRPVRFTAGGFAILSIVTFTSIIKASYSFFTLLQNMNNPVQQDEKGKHT